jgi:hypothetical protein
MRQSQEERILAAKIIEARDRKAEIRHHRVLSEQQHAARRQKEFEALLERDAQIGRTAKIEYEAKVIDLYKRQSYSSPNV